MNVAFVRWLLIVVTKIIYFVDANWVTGNLCWSMPCMNGGSCFGSAYTYLCVCPVNYSGALCEKRLGICQENPCGNRGLCVETGLYSFECRCYFDYMGPLCEEHIPKNDASLWSSLIPVHTRVLFDILQEAYRVKAHGRSALDSDNGQIDFPGLLSTNDVSSSVLVTTLPTKLKSDSIARQSETTKAVHIIRAEDIQLENIFPQISTLSTSNIYTQSFMTPTSPTFETTLQDDYYSDTTFSMDTTSEMMRESTENTPTTLLSLMTGKNVITISTGLNQTNDLNTTEDQEFFHTTEQYITMITSMPREWSSSSNDNDTIDYTREIMQNSTAQISNNTETEEFLENTTSQTLDYTSSETTNFYQTDDNSIDSSEPTMTSILTPSDPTTNSESAHHQVLLKLCQQLLSQILPNVTSLSSSAAIEAALSLSSGSPSSGNNSAEALHIWIKEQLSSTTLPPSTTATTTKTTTSTSATTTTTTTTTISSSLPSLLINEKKIPLNSLQRVDMDDILHQMDNNNNMDGENE